MIRVIIEGPRDDARDRVASFIAASLADGGYSEITVETRQPADPITYSINVEMGDLDPDKVADMMMRKMTVALTPLRKPTFWEKVKGYFR